MIRGMEFRRVAHWVLGLGVTAVLVLQLAFHLVAAGLIAGADPRSAAAQRVAGYTSRARSTVLDVDRDRDRIGIGYVVHVRYAMSGETVVTTVDWTDDRRPPAIGDTLDVAVDPAVPEHAVAADPAVRGVRSWSVRRHVVWAGVDAVLAVLVLGAAIRWAPRRRPTPAGEAWSEPWPAPPAVPPGPAAVPPRSGPPPTPPGGWATPR